MRVLVVDDDEEVRDLVSRALERDGHMVRVASSLEEARAALVDPEPDLIVLDMALPDGTGIALCEELRAAQASVPILMLTAHSEVSRRVLALDAGADDFLGKPFSVAELRARVRALGRRRSGGLAATVYTFGLLRLDAARRLATHDGADVTLTAREWQVLEALISASGRVVTRDRLLEELWGEITEASGKSLEVLIGRIRRKVGEGTIRTVRGIGYALEIP